MRVDRQTYTHTDSLITILCSVPLSGAKIIVMALIWGDVTAVDDRRQ